MSYTPYASITDYANYGLVELPDEDTCLRYLRQASRHIDTLTFNRIVETGFDNLSEFRQEIIREVVCRQAAFEYENADEIASVLSGYSINGVSVQFGQSWNVYQNLGVAMQKDNYALLQQSGLCYRGLGRY